MDGTISFEQLQSMGAKPIKSTASPTANSSPSPAADGTVSFDQLKAMGAKPIGAEDSKSSAAGTSKGFDRVGSDPVANAVAGFGKEAGATLKTLGTLGQNIANQTAGRVANLFTGHGFTPTPGPLFPSNTTRTQGDIYSSDTPASDNANSALELQGTAQQVGGAVEKVAEFFTPVGIENAISANSAKYLPKVPALLSRSVGSGIEQGIKAKLTGESNSDAVVTAGLGAATPFAAPLLKPLAKLLPRSLRPPTAVTDNFVHELVTPQQTVKTSVQNIKAGRVEEGGFFRPRNVTADARQLAIEKEVKTVPGLDPNGSALQNSNAIHDEIGNTADTLRSSLNGREVVPIVTQKDMTKLVSDTMTKIGEDPTMVGNAQESATRVIKKFQSFLPKSGDITATDILNARQKLDTWVGSLKGDRIFDPATDNALSIALRATRQGANDLLASKAPDVAVKTLLKRQSLLYDAIENIAPKAAKEGNTGLNQFLKQYPAVKTAAKYGAVGLGGGLVGSEAIKHFTQ